MYQLAEERALKAPEQERKRKKKKAREGPEDDKEALQTLHALRVAIGGRSERHTLHLQKRRVVDR